MLKSESRHSQSDSAKKGDYRRQPTSLSSLGDLRIWTMFREGHEGAFNYIYKKHFELLLNYGFLYINDKELIKDCIQDLFIELRKSGAKLSETDNIKYYLFKSLRWKISHQLRKRRRFSFHADMSDYFKLGFERSHEAMLLNIQVNEEIKSNIGQALSLLPKRQKEAVYYFYFEDFSYQQVADIMKLRNIKSARNLIYKALASLKKNAGGLEKLLNSR